MIYELTIEEKERIKKDRDARVAEGTYTEIDNDPDGLQIMELMTIISKHYTGEYVTVTSITDDTNGERFITILFAAKVAYPEQELIHGNYIGAMTEKHLKDRLAEVFNALTATGAKASLKMPIRYQFNGFYEFEATVYLTKQEG